MNRTAPGTTPPTIGPRLPVIWIVLTYAIFAALWILLSDLALDWWLDTPRLLAVASTLKGWMFVAVTSALLYALLRRDRGDSTGGALAELAPPTPGSAWFPLSMLALIIAALTAGDITLIHSQLEKNTEAARAQAMWVVLAGLLAMFMAVAGVYMLRQRQQLRLARAVGQAQAERLRALRLLATIADNSADVIFAKDTQGRYVLFNPGAEALFGHPAAEVLGQDDSAVLLPNEAARAAEIDRRVLAGGETLLVEHVLSVPAGQRTMQITLGPLRNETGQVIGLYGIARDITDRARMEQAIMDAKTRLELALQATNQGLYDLDVPSGVAIVSPEYASILGYDPGSFQETNAAWMERLHPDDRERVIRNYQDYIGGNLSEYRVEFRQRTASGDWKWILSLGRIVAWDVDGKPARMLGTHTDITELKQAGAALAESERRFRTLFEQAPMGIDMVGPDGVPLRANRALEQLLGYTEAEMRLHHFNYWTHPEDREASQTLVRRLLAGEADSLSMEKRYVSKDGQVVWAHTHVAAVRDATGAVEYFVVVVEDLTERKRALDELSQRYAELEAFNRAAVGRELAMIELKRRINDLTKRQGEAPPYDLDDFGVQQESSASASRCTSPRSLP